MSAPNTGAAVRAEAARVIDAVTARGHSLDEALASADAALDAADRPLLRMLCYGTLRNHWRLKEFVRQLLEKPLKSSDSVIESLIALGLFQLAESRVPDHAAVSLTVDAARRLRKPKLAPLVNAVLRNFVRKNLAVTEPSTVESRFNHPPWFIERLQQDWPEHWEKILLANNQRAPMWLRVNARKTSARRYLELLGSGGSQEARDEAGPEIPAAALLGGFEQAIRLGSPRAVTDLPGFVDGFVSVQDAAAQLAAPWLLANGLSARTGGQLPNGSLRILDACAAPGGKAAHLLELCGPDASLMALDADDRRLGFVRDNLERLGLTATLVAADASDPEAWWDGQPFDRILLDAPCSGTGVIRRHPDIKLLRRKADIDNSATRQLALLEALWPLLAPGGRLLYVTCSVLAAENDEVIGRFMSRTPEAIEDNGEQVLPDYNIRDLMHRRTRGFQILPGERDLDGFYYACLDKPGRKTG